MKVQDRAKAMAAILVVFACAMLYGATGASATEDGQASPPKYPITPQIEQGLRAGKAFAGVDAYATFYGIGSPAVATLDIGMGEAISLVSVWPGTVTRREVSQGVYAEFWTRTQRRPTGLYIWSEMLLTNGKDEERQVMANLKTPDFLITNGAVSLPENAMGSVAGGAWSGSSVTEQHSEGEITYLKTKFTATLTLGETAKTIAPICTMVSNAPEGNRYRVGLIHAVWNGEETQDEIPVPQAPGILQGTPDPGPPAAPAKGFAFIDNPVYNPQTVYGPDSNGVLTIPFSVKEIKKDTFICLGQVPCMTKNADTISVQVRSESGNGITVLVNEADLSAQYEDYCFLDWCDNGTPGEINGSFDGLRDASYNNHTGNFYIYVGAKEGTDLKNVSGAITIETYTGNE